MNARWTSAVVLLSVFAASASAALVSPDNLPVAVRPTGECADNDYECLCVKAVSVNNEIRARHGKNAKPVAGPKRMLQNAVDHSKELKVAFEHQDLTEAKHKVQCGVFIRGENIAMHHGTGDDHVKLCMDQWEVRRQNQIRRVCHGSKSCSNVLALSVPMSTEVPRSSRKYSQRLRLHSYRHLDRYGWLNVLHSNYGTHWSRRRLSDRH
jgi:hypothetical protein